MGLNVFIMLIDHLYICIANYVTINVIYPVVSFLLIFIFSFFFLHIKDISLLFILCVADIFFSSQGLLLPPCLVVYL